MCYTATLWRSVIKFMWISISFIDMPFKLTCSSFTLSRWWPYGTGHLKYSSDPATIPLLWMCGQWAVYLLRWWIRGHCFLGTLRLMNYSKSSGLPSWTTNFSSIFWKVVHRLLISFWKAMLYESCVVFNALKNFILTWMHLANLCMSSLLCEGKTSQLLA